MLSNIEWSFNHCNDPGIEQVEVLLQVGDDGTRDKKGGLESGDFSPPRWTMIHVALTNQHGDLPSGKLT